MNVGVEQGRESTDSPMATEKTTKVNHSFGPEVRSIGKKIPRSKCGDGLTFPLHLVRVRKAKDDDLENSAFRVSGDSTRILMGSQI